MQHVPKDIETFYRDQLKKVDVDKHQSYVKWIRYFLDFCSKYRFTPYERTSFSHFSQKLNDKKQSLTAIEDAYQAYLLLIPYYQIPVNEGELNTDTDVVQQLIAVIRQKATHHVLYHLEFPCFSFPNTLSSYPTTAYAARITL